MKWKPLQCFKDWVEKSLHPPLVKKGEWLDLVGRREEDSVGVMRDFQKRLNSVRKLKIRTHISLRG
uniref:Uncharacterized protein n=1 Tax=Brassica oleracea TaxID=3712 RepID=A0A3P6EV65_BRAOL|nr:unnamed protein product [Brassica oleracea]